MASPQGAALRDVVDYSGHAYQEVGVPGGWLPQPTDAQFPSQVLFSLNSVVTVSLSAH